MADKLLVGSEMVSRYENGKSVCKIDHLYVLCQLFDVSSDYLIYGNDKSSKMETFPLIAKLLESASDFDIDRIYQMIQLMIKKDLDIIICE